MERLLQVEGDRGHPGLKDETPQPGQGGRGDLLRPVLAHVGEDPILVGRHMAFLHAFRHDAVAVDEQRGLVPGEFAGRLGYRCETDVDVARHGLDDLLAAAVEEAVPEAVCRLVRQVVGNVDPVYRPGDREAGQHGDRAQEDQALAGLLQEIDVHPVEDVQGNRVAAPFCRRRAELLVKDTVVGALAAEAVPVRQRVDVHAPFQQVAQRQRDAAPPHVLHDAGRGGTLPDAQQVVLRHVDLVGDRVEVERLEQMPLDIVRRVAENGHQMSVHADIIPNGATRINAHGMVRAHPNANRAISVGLPETLMNTASHALLH